MISARGMLDHHITLALLGDDQVILKGAHKSKPPPNTLTSSALLQCSKLYKLEKYLFIHVIIIIVMS